MLEIQWIFGEYYTLIEQEGRLLLFAEMKLPGEAWLQFKIHENKLIQTATFRPRGLLGRLILVLCTSVSFLYI